LLRTREMLSSSENKFLIFISESFTPPR